MTYIPTVKSEVDYEDKSSSELLSLMRRVFEKNYKEVCWLFGNDRYNESGESYLFKAFRLSDGKAYVIKLSRCKISWKEYQDRHQKKFEHLFRLGGMFPDNVVKVREFGYLKGLKRCYEVQEFIEYGNIEEFIEKRFPGTTLIKDQFIRNVISEISKCLRVIHTNKIIHLDIKPANILVRSPIKPELVLTDFGISKLNSGGSGKIKVGVEGTMPFISPEILFLKEAGACSDYWAFGMTILRLLYNGLPEEEHDLFFDDSIIENTIKNNKIWELISKITAVDNENGKYIPLLKGLLTTDSHKRWKYEQVSEWIEKTRYLVKYDFPHRLYDKENHSLAGIVSRITKNSRSWAETYNFFHHEIETWLDKNSDGEILEWIKKIKLKYPENEGLAFTEFVYSIDPYLPFYYYGNSISSNKLLSYFRAVYENGNKTDDFINSFFSGDIIGHIELYSGISANLSYKDITIIRTIVNNIKKNNNEITQILKDIIGFLALIIDHNQFFISGKTFEEKCCFAMENHSEIFTWDLLKNNFLKIAEYFFRDTYKIIENCSLPDYKKIAEVIRWNETDETISILAGTENNPDKEIIITGVRPMKIRSKIINLYLEALNCSDQIGAIKHIRKLRGELLNPEKKHYIKNFELLSRTELIKIKKLILNNDRDSMFNKELMEFFNSCTSAKSSDKSNNGSAAVIFNPLKKKYGMAYITIRKKTRGDGDSSDGKLEPLTKKLVDDFILSGVLADEPLFSTHYIEKTIDMVIETYPAGIIDDSIMLGMAAAYLSKIFNTSFLKQDVVYSSSFYGRIENNFSVKFNKDPEKIAKTLFEEFPKCKNIYFAGNDGNSKNKGEYGIKFNPCDSNINSLNDLFKLLGLNAANIKSVFSEAVLQKSISYSLNWSCSESLEFFHETFNSFAQNSDNLNIKNINIFQKLLEGYMKNLLDLKLIEKTLEIYNEYYVSGNCSKYFEIDTRLKIMTMAARCFREYMCFKEANENFEAVEAFFINSRMPVSSGDDREAQNAFLLAPSFQQCIGAHARSLFEEFFAAGDKSAKTVILKKFEYILSIIREDDRHTEKLKLLFSFIRSIHSNNIETIYDDILPSAHKAEPIDRYNLYLIACFFKPWRNIESALKDIRKLKGGGTQTLEISKICLFYNCALMCVKLNDPAQAIEFVNASVASVKIQRFKCGKNSKLNKEKMASLLDIFEFIIGALGVAISGKNAGSVEKNPEISLKSSLYLDHIIQVKLGLAEMSSGYDREKTLKYFQPLFLF